MKQSNPGEQGEVHKISFAKSLKLCVLCSELLHFNEMAEVHSTNGFIQCKMNLVICIVVSLKNEWVNHKLDWEKCSPLKKNVRVLILSCSRGRDTQKRVFWWADNGFSVTQDSLKLSDTDLLTWSGIYIDGGGGWGIYPSQCWKALPCRYQGLATGMENAEL